MPRILFDSFVTLRLMHPSSFAYPSKLLYNRPARQTSEDHVTPMNCLLPAAGLNKLTTAIAERKY